MVWILRELMNVARTLSLLCDWLKLTLGAEYFYLIFENEPNLTTNQSTIA